MCHCGKPIKAKGLCSTHYLADYRRRKEAGEIVKVSLGAILIAHTLRRAEGEERNCGVIKCGLPIRSRGLCSKHYLRLNRAERKNRSA